MSISRMLGIGIAFAIVAAALIGAPFAVPTANASPPAAASGTFYTSSATFNSVRVAGGNTIISLTATVDYTGTFNGSSVVEGTLIFHADGSANFHDVETFTGTVNGAPGTVTFNLEGASTPEGVYHGTDVVLGATGGLANLHGVIRQIGTVPAPIGPAGTYSGEIH